MEANENNQADETEVGIRNEVLVLCPMCSHENWIGEEKADERWQCKGCGQQFSFASLS